MDEGIHISDVSIIRRGSKLSGFNHFHLHEHFNILGLLPYRAVEKRHSFQLRDPTSLIGSFNYKRISTKTQDGCNYLLPTIDSPMESLDALMRYGKIRPHDFDTPNVTRKVDTFSLNNPA